MKIIFSCICGQLLTTSSVISGFKISCPNCQIRMTVPLENKIIEIDYRDVIDPRGDNRETKITCPDNNPKKYGCSYDEWDKIDPISHREIP